MKDNENPREEASVLPPKYAPYIQHMANCSIYVKIGTCSCGLVNVPGFLASRSSSPAVPSDTERLKADRQALIDQKVIPWRGVLNGTPVIAAWVVADEVAANFYATADEALDAYHRSPSVPEKDNNDSR